MAQPLWQLIGVTLTNLVWERGDFSDNSKTKQHYLEHNELVRRVCPPDRLLEFKLGSGWEPLCKFLGTEAPDVPYPNVNDHGMFVKLHRVILDRATIWAVQKVLVGAVPFGIIAGAAWYWQKLRR